MSKSSEARRNMVPLKNSVEEGPQEVEVIGWRLDPERSMGPVGYFGRHHFFGAQLSSQSNSHIHT